MFSTFAGALALLLTLMGIIVAQDCGTQNDGDVGGSFPSGATSMISLPGPFSEHNTYPVSSANFQAEAHITTFFVKGGFSSAATFVLANSQQLPGTIRFSFDVRR